LKTSDFYYHLPKEFIAQKPVHPRDSSRLLIYNRASGEVNHKHFVDLVGTFNSNDLLVLNHTRVIQARLFGKKIPTGGKVELLLLREMEEGCWAVKEDLGGPLRLVEFQEPIQPYLNRIGNVPLPPYIHETLKEPERYQTIYARQIGSSAAPTAGLHFTSKLLQTIRSRGVRIAEVTLHIGLDTFAPVNEENPRNHIIHREWCQLPESTASEINITREKKGRIIAVGTTSVRTLETAARESKNPDIIEPYEGETGLFILPGYNFQVVGICWQGKYSGAIRDSDAKRVPILFFRGCNAVSVRNLVRYDILAEEDCCLQIGAKLTG